MHGMIMARTTRSDQVFSRAGASMKFVAVSLVVEFCRHALCQDPRQLGGGHESGVTFGFWFAMALFFITFSPLVIGGFLLPGWC
jgi:hypothetical protein